MEDKVPAGIAPLVELGNADTDETLTLWNRKANEVFGEFIGLVQQRPAMAVGAKSRPEPLSRIRRAILEEDASSLFRVGSSLRKFRGGSAKGIPSNFRRTIELIRFLKLRDRVK